MGENIKPRVKHQATTASSIRSIKNKRLIVDPARKIPDLQMPLGRQP